MKSRVSMITIALLLLVIIGLVVTLVVANLNNNSTEVQQGELTSNEENNQSGQSSVDETPTYISLDNTVVQDMANIVGPELLEDYFFDFKGDYKDVNDFSNQDKMIVAYFKYAINNETKDEKTYMRSFTKEDMDKGMMKVFGNTDYQPEDFKVLNLYGFEYDEATQTFNQADGGGGSGPYGTWAVTGIYKVEEYSNRYEAYSKYIILNPTNTNVKNSSGLTLGGLWEVVSGISYRDDILGTYRDYESTEEYSWIPYIKEYISGVETKSIVFGDCGTVNSEGTKEIMYKHFDEASEYKHTFMKNEDGSYYWVKSEIVK